MSDTWSTFCESLGSLFAVILNDAVLRRHGVIRCAPRAAASHGEIAGAEAEIRRCLDAIKLLAPGERGE